MHSVLLYFLFLRDEWKRGVFVCAGYNLIWILLVPLTLICVLKEIYQFSVLRKAYISFENVIQDTFILLLLLQWILLAAGLKELIRSVSVVRRKALCSVNVLKPIWCLIMRILTTCYPIFYVFRLVRSSVRSSWSHSWARLLRLAAKLRHWKRLVKQAGHNKYSQ